MMVALAAAFAIGFTEQRNSSRVTSSKLPSKILLGAMALAVMLVIQFAMYRILNRFGTDPLADARIGFTRDTIRAAISFMPFGSGMGTFVPVYGMFEQPEYLLVNAYANHAHDDFVELWLESGAIGMGIVLAFLIWFVWRSVRIWRTFTVGARKIDFFLVRAADIALALLIAHSFVDYPLRTGAIMAIFAFSCALLIEPLAGADGSMNTASGDDPRTVRRKEVEMSADAIGSLSFEPRPSAEQLRRPANPPNPTRQSDERWGEDIDWPEAWNKPGTKNPSGGNE
jgi:O-antigen ligase